MASAVQRASKATERSGEPARRSGNESEEDQIRRVGRREACVCGSGSGMASVGRGVRLRELRDVGSGLRDTCIWCRGGDEAAGGLVFRKRAQLR